MCSIHTHLPSALIEGWGSLNPCSDLVSYRRVFILACTVERIMYSTIKGFNYRKLEIQVLGARPMSEVGFRDVRASPQNSPTPQRHHNNVSVNRCLLPINKCISVCKFLIIVNII